ncbi:hypothetical protein SAMN05443550_102357 [Pedobacter hartonius]|uniref:Uncharacterized protein n=1 Tax=Pedobacter hartonius TaxID=425514 RepID=A0A1H3ZHB7_9SPHI|nr:hypothetical protein SAMN05443550_102357 [Pedobacter hartonius]
MAAGWPPFLLPEILKNIKYYFETKNIVYTFNYTLSSFIIIIKINQRILWKLKI